MWLFTYSLLDEEVGARLIILFVMSQKNKIRHAKREAQQEEQGKKVVRWVFGVLVALALIYMVYSIFMLQ